MSHAAEDTLGKGMIWLREFSWRYFTMTGDIDAYLLYKKHEEVVRDWDDMPADPEEAETYPDSP